MTGDMISRQAAIDAIIEDKICDDSLKIILMDLIEEHGKQNNEEKPDANESWGHLLPPGVIY